jgi:AraC-like DNA-binding protein
VADELEIRRPGPLLSGHVHRLCGYSVTRAGPAREREPLMAGVVLIFGLGPELRLIEPSGAPTRLGSFFAGLGDRCAVVEHDGEMSGLQVDLSPLAARMIFGVPMHELARRVVTLEEALGREGPLLEERLAQAGSWSARFELVEAALAARLEAAEAPPPDVDRAWRRLESARGRIRVAELATELGCSRKHLAARFRDHVGLPPKLVARMLRFRETVDRMLASPHSTITEVAAACGYYDHAHLDRDFRDFAGTTPTAYAADPRTPATFVQDGAALAS